MLCLQIYTLRKSNIIQLTTYEREGSSWITDWIIYKRETNYIG